MPRYYFDIYNSLGPTLDEEGQECSDILEARQQALTGIRSLLGGELAEGEIDLNGRLEIRDEESTVILTVFFADAIRIKPAGPEGR